MSPLSQSHGSPNRIIVHNHKGGTGKTMLAVHVIEYLVEHGHPWSFFDADPQRNGISWITGHHWEGQGSIRLPGEGRREPLTATIEPEMAASQERLVIDTPPTETALEQLEERGLGPREDDLLLCPAGGRFSIDGAIKVAEEVRPTGCRVILVANMTDPKDDHGAEEIRAMQELDVFEDAGVEVFKMAIPENKKYMRKAELQGMPVWELPYAPRTYTVKSLEALCRWISQGAPPSANKPGELGAGAASEKKAKRVQELQDRLWS